MSFYVDERNDATQQMFRNFLDDMDGREDYLGMKGFASKDIVFITTTGLTCEMFKRQEKDINDASFASGESLRATQITTPIEVGYFGEPVKTDLMLKEEYKYGAFLFQHNPKNGFHYVLSDTLILSTNPQDLRKYLSWFFSAAKSNETILEDSPFCVLLSYENANKIAAAFVPQDSDFTPKDVEYFSQIKVENFDTIKDLVVGYLDKLLPVQEKENNL